MLGATHPFTKVFGTERRKVIELRQSETGVLATS